MRLNFTQGIRIVGAGAIALLLFTAPLSAKDNKTDNKGSAAPMSKRTAAAEKSHRLILQVNANDPAMMNLALNNATNVAQYYKDLGEKVAIEIITFGPGLHMLREDTSPVKARIETLALSNPEISFKACGNTQENMSRAENKAIPIVPQATVVKSGVVRVLELQEQGWSYVKP
jgi:intracellular sulfur oxidation DsrE/DsrF family protein